MLIIWSDGHQNGVQLNECEWEDTHHYVNKPLKYFYWVFTAVLGTSWSLCKTGAPAVHRHPRLLLNTSFGISQHPEQARMDAALSLATKTLVEKTQITQPPPVGTPSHNPHLPQPVAGNLMPQHKWRNIRKSVLLNLLLWPNPGSHRQLSTGTLSGLCVLGVGPGARKCTEKATHLTSCESRTTAYDPKDPLPDYCIKWAEKVAYPLFSQKKGCTSRPRAAWVLTDLQQDLLQLYDMA